MYNNQSRMQPPSQQQQPNQYGAYGQGMSQGIGSTPTEQMMQGSMGGLQQVMQADQNTGYRGSAQSPQQWGQSGQYGMTSGQSNYSGQQQGYMQPNQYGAYGQGMSQGIGSTPTEQKMQGSMGGLQHVMQADRNMGYGGSGQSQQQYGGMQQGYMQPNQYGAYGQGMSQGIGSTPTEQRMQGSMGGLQQVMQADRNMGYGGSGQSQQQYGQQQGYMQPNQYGAYGQGMSQGIGSTPTEQRMQGSMGGLQQVMQADRNMGYGGSGQSQQQYGQQQGYMQPNQYGAYGQGKSQGIGSTPSEQKMQRGMGGMQQVMQAAQPSGYYGQNNMQQPSNSPNYTGNQQGSSSTSSQN